MKSRNHRIFYVCGLIVASALGAVPIAASDSIEVRRDVHLEKVWYVPRNPPRVGSASGPRFVWACYPLISQSIDGMEKKLVLSLELSESAGALGGSEVATSRVSFTVDGQTVDIPDALWRFPLGLNGGHSETTLSDQERLIRKIGAAKSVVLTYFRPIDNLAGSSVPSGPGHAVRLTEKQIAVFGAILNRYDSLNPR